MAENSFDIEVLADGAIKVTSAGGFSQETHQKADEFLDYLQGLMGGKRVTRKLPRSLGNPHATQTLGGQQQHKLGG